MTRLTSPSRLLPSLVVAAVSVLGAMALGACTKLDIGGPCNHGTVNPPNSKLVTFPALSCDNLLCVYAVEQEAKTTPCVADADCFFSPDEAMDPMFECVKSNPERETGKCRLRIDFVLERSMCSRKCEGAEDCQDPERGPGKVIAEDTACEKGFSCEIIQELGTFCCQKMCVCNDDLGDNSDLEMKCNMKIADGCKGFDTNLPMGV